MASLVQQELSQLLERHPKVLDCDECGDYMVPQRITFVARHQGYHLTLKNFPAFVCICCDHKIYQSESIEVHVAQAIEHFEENGEEEYDCS